MEENGGSRCFGGRYDGNLNCEKTTVKSALIGGINGEKNICRTLAHRLWR